MGPMFMTVLINKKYSLPYSLIDRLVQHFWAFREEAGFRQLPLVWHRCLLTFVQRYKREFSETQREQLFKLAQLHHHEAGISTEIKRELRSCRPRLVNEQGQRVGHLKDE